MGVRFDEGTEGKGKGSLELTRARGGEGRTSSYRKERREKERRERTRECRRTGGREKESTR